LTKKEEAANLLEVGRVSPGGAGFLAGRSGREDDRLESLSHKKDANPERKLLEAILTDAIECWQLLALHPIASRFENVRSPIGKRQRNYRDAHFWFFGDYDNAPYFSFTKICDCLGLDPDFIRRRLLEWRRKELQRLEACAALPLARSPAGEGSKERVLIVRNPR
jgi:hypothetical protein